MNKMHIRKLLALVLALVLSTTILAGCSEPAQEIPEDTTPALPVIPAEELMQENSFLLASGESVQLTLATTDATLTSLHPEVVTVDEPCEPPKLPGLHQAFSIPADYLC